MLQAYEIPTYMYLVHSGISTGNTLCRHHTHTHTHSTCREVSLLSAILGVVFLCGEH